MNWHRLRCMLTGHRRTVTIPFDEGEECPWYLPCKGHRCSCGARWSVVLADSFEEPIPLPADTAARRLDKSPWVAGMLARAGTPLSQPRPCRICGRPLDDHGGVESMACLRGYADRQWILEAPAAKGRELWRLLLPVGVQCFGLLLALFAASSPAGAAGALVVFALFTSLTMWVVKVTTL